MIRDLYIQNLFRMLTSLLALSIGLLLLFGCGTTGDAQAPTIMPTNTSIPNRPNGTVTVPDGVQPSLEPIAQPSLPQPTTQGSSLPQANAGTTPADNSESDASMQPTTEPLGNPADWPLYTDADFGFTVHYPSIYAIVPEPAQTDPSAPDRLKQVRFLDKALAASDTAQLQPADFTIEVFTNSSNRSLKDWIDTQMPTGERNLMTLGGQPAYKVQLKTQQYPNQFYYISFGRHIFRITAAGTYGEQMLTTIAFTI